MTDANGSLSTTRPLEGLQVVELSAYVAGPSGAMTLAQLGADVIRIDPVGGADTAACPSTRRATASTGPGSTRASARWS